MHDLRMGVALFLLLTVLLGLVRVARGPTFGDRILVAQLFGTSGVSVLLLLSADPGRSHLRNVALVFSLLAAVTVIAFVRVASNRGGAR
jgi:multicomponent Na+:H+ antiporter subunit F